MSTDSSPLRSSTVINEAVQTLRDGGLVAFPTETVYGLGADARNPGAINKIFRGTKKGEITEVAIMVAPTGNWATSGAAKMSYKGPGPG